MAVCSAAAAAAAAAAKQQYLRLQYSGVACATQLKDGTLPSKYF
jgi:hypothetical protein